MSKLRKSAGLVTIPDGPGRSMSSTQLSPVVRLRTTEPDVIRASIRGMRTSALQFVPTGTESELTHIPMPSQQLDIVRFAPAFEFEGATSPENATVVFVLATPQHGHSFNFSTDTEPGLMGFWPMEGPLHSITPAGYRNATLTLPLEELVRALESRDVRPPPRFLNCATAMRTNAATLLAMQELIAEIRFVVAGGDSVLEDRRWRLNLERATRALFADALAGGIRHLVPEASLSLQKSETRFRRARDYMAAHLGQPLYLDDLCHGLRAEPARPPADFSGKNRHLANGISFPATAAWSPPGAQDRRRMGRNQGRSAQMGLLASGPFFRRIPTHFW